MSRELRAAFRTSKRELGDHRRWWWQATMPRVYFDPVLVCDTEVLFDHKCGRLYRPLRAFASVCAYPEEDEVAAL